MCTRFGISKHCFGLQCSPGGLVCELKKGRGKLPKSLDLLSF
jgi:hypothetical protein